MPTLQVLPAICLASLEKHRKNWRCPVISSNSNLNDALFFGWPNFQGASLLSVPILVTVEVFLLAKMARHIIFACDIYLLPPQPNLKTNPKVFCTVIEK